jgi:XTP/dITP diphosphohydrolase
MADKRLRRTWVLASGNPGKAREFDALLAPLGIEMLMQNRLGISDADEPHATFVENALAKARHACAAAGMVALADDSGICVPALGGAPGVRSARYSEPEAGWERDRIDLANNRKLVRETAALAAPVACFYYCVIVLLRHPDDPRPLIAEGRWDGAIVAQPRGSHGFGYDPHFLPAGEAVTAAEMDPARKNVVSHRARAMARLAAALADELAGETVPAPRGSSG